MAEKEKPPKDPHRLIEALKPIDHLAYLIVVMAIALLGITKISTKINNLWWRIQLLHLQRKKDSKLLERDDNEQ